MLRRLAPGLAGGILARTPILRSIERLARDHHDAERLGIAPAEVRERRGEAAISRREVIKRGAAGAAVALAGPAGPARRARAATRSTPPIPPVRRRPPRPQA